MATRRPTKKDLEEQFEPLRDEKWNEIMAKAARLALMLPLHPGLTEQYGWWFENFKVDPAAEKIALDISAGRLFGKADLTHSKAEDALNSLREGISYLEEFLEEEEAKRQEELRRAKIREDAIAKLTDEELKVLGLSRPYNRARTS